MFIFFLIYENIILFLIPLVLASAIMSILYRNLQFLKGEKKRDGLKGEQLILKSYNAFNRVYFCILF